MEDRPLDPTDESAKGAPRPGGHLRRAFLTGAVAVAAVPASGRSAPRPWRRSAAVVKLGVYSDTIFTLPIWIAMERGYFKANGIAFELETVRNIRQVGDALLAGASPIAMTGPEVVFFDKAGADRVCIAAGNANRLPHFLIAQPRFNSIADLRGATFGVISETEGTTFVIQKLAAGAGLRRSEYKIAAVGGAPARAKLLDEGVIDAALQPFPLSYEAEAKGFKNLGWAGLAQPDWQFSAVLMHRGWLEANQDIAANFLRAAVQGRRFMAQQPASAAQIAAQYLKTSYPLARRALDDTLRLGIMDPDLRWSPVGLGEVYRNLQTVGALPADKEFRIQDYVDSRSLARALRSL